MKLVRKLNLIGGHTLAVTLPLTWLEYLKIDRNSLVILDIDRKRKTIYVRKFKSKS